MKKDEVNDVEANTNIHTVVEKLEPYEASLKYEEERSKHRSEGEDQEQYAAICQQIRVWMKEILKLKNDKSEKAAGEIEERRMLVLMQMLSLRQLSRIQKVRVKEAREQTIDHRQSVDGVTLKLQNLLYEVAHLKKEVRRCLEFESADKEIDLIPIEQFYKEAPESICRPEETVENPHQQRLAQLHWELEQRRGQTQLFDQLTQEKERVALIIDQQESKLSSLAPIINSILQATAPLQDALDLPLDKKKLQQKQSQYLPAPLYTLWVQATAYSEACDSLLRADILGDLEAAKKLVDSSEDEKNDASDSEAELDFQEENLPRKSRLQKEKQKTENVDIGDALLKQLLTLHPLYINMTVKTNDNNCICVTFYYATCLKIVTTKCSVKLPERSKPVLTDILHGDSFLSCLFPCDSGTVSPNPSNVYQLLKLNLTELSSCHLSSIGRPFKWAQMLAGLSFFSPEPVALVDEASVLSEDAEDCTDKKESEGDEVLPSVLTEEPISVSLPKIAPECVSWRVSAEHMSNIIVAIRRRLQARLALRSQLDVLETADSTSSIPLSREVLQQHFPGKISSDLRSWLPITWADYEAQHCSKSFIDAEFVNEDHLLFKATYERNMVKMDAYVGISPDYPNAAPSFALSLSWNGQHDATSDPHVKQMECEVNVYWHEMISTRKHRLQVLSLQLYRLAMCLDIFTEALSVQIEGGTKSSVAAFHKEKIFFRPTRGPDRALPLKYLPKLGVFAQR